MIKIYGKEIKFETFPNNETRLNEASIWEAIKSMPFSHKDILITLTYENDIDLVRLGFIKKYLDTELSQDFRKILVITYMPYSRMDRVERKGNGVGNAFTLKYVADFINSLYFDCVAVIQPHSDVTMGLLNKSFRIEATKTLAEKLMEDLDFDSNKDLIYYPDGSSYKNLSKFFRNKKELIAYKQRNFDTGEILGVTIVGDSICKNESRVIMVDDLICGGRTFIEGAKKLKKMGVKEIYVVTAHSEPVMFERDLFKTEEITKVITTDSILKNGEDEKLEIVSCEDVIRNHGI